jgi:hypothetical protein
VAKSGDTYIERLCDALADVLTNAATGTRDRLAGYVANFDFWIDEADHCLRLIDEYDQRFQRFQAAQRTVASGAPLRWDERSGWTPPPAEVKRSSTWNERKEAKRKVVGAMAKFLNRCAKEGFIDEAKRSATAAKISG